MKLELKPDGYERLDARIRKIEEVAMAGIFTDDGAVKRFHQIASELKKLRQTLREVLEINPKAKTEGSNAA